MTTRGNGRNSVENIEKNIPFLRRYGRALSGNQPQGDQFAAATLDAILGASEILDPELEPKVALFSVFQSIWTDAKATALGPETSPLAAQAQRHLETLRSGTRDALLLNSLEEFSLPEISTIMGVDEHEVRKLLDQAYSDMAEAVTGRVLIIEDDLVAADDLESVVTEMGHHVTGNADTHAAAVMSAMEDEPDLIIADVVLADDTSGVDAAAEILNAYHKKPVIFVTGHPEQLLTGKKREPAFLIPKPYMHDQVRTAVSQALFFSSTDALEVLEKA